MISIVCAYNDERILDGYLLKGLNNQSSTYELIALDNTQRRYDSAAEALNYGGIKAKGDYIMFAHQDLRLNSSNWLSRTEGTLNGLPNLGIAGVAGNKDLRGTITNIKHGCPPRSAGRTQIEMPIKVQTLDECLFIIPKSIFHKIQFDEETCMDWHLYAVDYCLSLKKLGFDAYLIPCSAYHRSSGYSFSEKYYVTLEKMLKKHKKNYNLIYTTMGNWSTRYPVCVQRLRIFRTLINRSLL